MDIDQKTIRNLASRFEKLPPGIFIAVVHSTEELLDTPKSDRFPGTIHKGNRDDIYLRVSTKVLKEPNWLDSFIQWAEVYIENKENLREWQTIRDFLRRNQPESGKTNPKDIVDYWMGRNEHLFARLSSDDPAQQAFDLLHNCAAIIVLNDKKPIGVVTKTDFLGKSSSIMDKLVAEFMVSSLTSLTTGCRMNEASDIFQHNPYDLVPIISQDGDFMGVVTKQNVMDWEFGHG